MMTKISAYYDMNIFSFLDERYIGCYTDSSWRVMDFKRYVRTVDECISICHRVGKYYAGLEAGRECRCGNKYDRIGPARQESECDHKCHGDHKTYCGGNWRMSVYKTGMLRDCTLFIGGTGLEI